MDEEINRKATSGFIWRLAERIGAEGVSLVVTVILARILDPSAFGELAIMTVFVSVMQIFVDSGLSTALIQKKNADDIDFSSVFFFNVVFCCFLYLVLFCLAPFIANYYNLHSITRMLRIQSLCLLISGIKNVQYAYVSKQLEFRKFFFSTLGGTVGAGIIGITMALKGFGTWALIAQSIFNTTIDTIILWGTVKWRPVLKFSFRRLKQLLSFSWKILVTVLIDSIYNDIRQLVIGKQFSSSDLAFYNKGSQYPKVIASSVSSSLDSVLFPVMAQKQDEAGSLLQLTRRSLCLGFYCIAPMMVGLFCVAEPFVKLILSEKWLLSVPFFKIFCITALFKPIHSAHFNAIYAVGRSDIVLKLGIIKTIIQITGLLISMRFGVMGIAIGYLICSSIGIVLDCIPNTRLLKYTIKAQLIDLLPLILINLIMLAFVEVISFLSVNYIVKMSIQIFVGVVTYICSSHFMRIKEFVYCKEYINSIFRRK